MFSHSIFCLDEVLEIFNGMFILIYCILLARCVFIALCTGLMIMYVIEMIWLYMSAYKFYMLIFFVMGCFALCIITSFCIMFFQMKSIFSVYIFSTFILRHRDPNKTNQIR